MKGYDFPPYRPPNEAGSILLRVTHGCPWNRCAFCSMYRGVDYAHRPLGDVKRDIENAVEIFGPGRRTVFLGDSNPVVVNELPDMLRFLYRAFPDIERVTSYARAKSLARLGVKGCRQLREAGLTRVHIGLESGDGETLSLLNKGAAPRDMVEGARTAREADLEISEYVLLGAGGSGGWQAHASNTAEVLNKIRPDFIRFRTLSLLPGTPLRQMAEDGKFTSLSPLLRLRETLAIVKGLYLSGTVVASDHVTNNVWMDGRLVYRGVNGVLPRDRQKMIAEIEMAIDMMKNCGGELLDSNDLLARGYITGL